MNTKKTITGRPTPKSQQVLTETASLVGCYGKIGISAVAAAVRYQGAAKNPAYAPASAERMFEWARDAAV